MMTMRARMLAAGASLAALTCGAGGAGAPGVVAPALEVRALVAGPTDTVTVVAWVTAPAGTDSVVVRVSSPCVASPGCGAGRISGPTGVGSVPWRVPMAAPPPAVAWWYPVRVVAWRGGQASPEAVDSVRVMGRYPPLPPVPADSVTVEWPRVSLETAVPPETVAALRDGTADTLVSGVGGVVEIAAYRASHPGWTWPE